MTFVTFSKHFVCHLHIVTIGVFLFVAKTRISITSYSVSRPPSQNVPVLLYNIDIALLLPIHKASELWI